MLQENLTKVHITRLKYPRSLDVFLYVVQGKNSIILCVCVYDPLSTIICQLRYITRFGTDLDA